MDGDLSAVQDGAAPITTPAHYDIQTSLDAWGAQLDAFLAAPLSVENAWLKFPVTVLNMFFTSPIVSDSFSHSLNGMATFINEFVPPFKMVSGAPEAITPASVTAATLAGAIEVMNIAQTWDVNVWGAEVISFSNAMVALASGDLINGLNDPIISAGAGAFLSPKTVLDKMVDVGPAPNPVSLVMYVAVIAIFRRFADVAIDHAPVLTGVSYSQTNNVTIDGVVDFYDQDFDPITGPDGFTLPDNGTWSLAIADAVDPCTGCGRFTFQLVNWNSGFDNGPQLLTFTFTIDALGDGTISVLHPYMPEGNDATTKLTVAITVYWPGVNVPSSTTDSLGVVRGDLVGDGGNGSLTYSLVDSGYGSDGAAGPLSAASAASTTSMSGYSAKGGIVKLNSDGTYTYIPTSTAGTTDSFQVRIADDEGRSTVLTVNVPVTAPQVTTVSSATNVQTVKLNLPGADVGMLTYAKGSDGAYGTVVVNPDGTYTYTRNPNLGHSVARDDTFTVIGTDSAGRTVTFAVAVAPPVTNAVPVGTGVTTTSPVGAPTYEAGHGPADEQHTTGTLHATDADGDALTFAAGTYTTSNGGSITVNADGTFSYSMSKYAYDDGAAIHTHDAYWHHAVGAVDTVAINVADNFGGTTAVTYGIPIASRNEAPTLNGTTGITRDALGVVRGTISGSDGDGDGLTYSLLGAGNPAGATATSSYTTKGGIVYLSGNSFTYVPTSAAGSTDSFNVLANDGHGGTATQTVNISVVQPATTTVGVTATTATVKLTIPTNDAGMLSYSVNSNGAHGTVVDNGNGTYTYTLNPGDTSPSDTFTLRGTDANGRSVTFTMTVAPSVNNRAPVAGGVVVTTNALNSVAGPGHRQVATGTLLATDADGDTVTFTTGTYSTANGGSITVNANGTYSYTSETELDAFGVPSSHWHAATADGAQGDTFTIALSDGRGGTTTATYSIPVYQQNTPPNATTSVSNTSTDALGVLRGTIVGSDPDGFYSWSQVKTIYDSLSYSMIGATGGNLYTANGGIVTINSNGTFTYVPKVGVTSDSFQVLVNDGHGGTTAATVNLTGLAAATQTTNGSTSTPNVVTGQINVPANDASLGGGWTYSLGAGPSKGTVTVNADGTYTYTRTAGLGHTTTPNDSFTIVATDATGKSVTIATINVVPSVANNAPVGNGVTTDSPVGAPTYNVWGGPSDEQHTTGTLHATDADGDTVTFAAGTYGTAQGGSVTVNADGTFTYDNSKSALAGIHQSYWHTHAADGDPGDTFTITIRDAFGGTTTATYGIPIAKLNNAPTLSSSVSGTDTLGVVRGTVSGSDNDGDGMTYSLVNATGGSVYTTNGGIVSMSGASFTYVPKVGVTSDSFQVQVNDGHGGVTTATVNLTGLTTPGTTTGVDRTTTLGTETGTLNIPSPSDTTGLGLTYSVGTGPSKGTVQLVNTNGTYTYTYVRNSSLGHTTTSADSFTIKATDATGKTVTVATINVAPNVVDNAPVVSTTTTDKGSTDSNKWRLDTLSSNGGNDRKQTTTGKITATDADGDTLTYSLVDPTTHASVTTTTDGGSVTLNADGSFTYTITKDKSYFHAAAKVGASAADTTDTFTVAVSDGLGGVAYTTVTMSTYAVNNAPTISGGTKASLFGLSPTVTGISVSDADGDSSGFGNVYSGSGAGHTITSRTYFNYDLRRIDADAGVNFSGKTITLTIYDGYYTVSNGVVTGTPAKSSPAGSWSF